MQARGFGGARELVGEHSPARREEISSSGLQGCVVQAERVQLRQQPACLQPAVPQSDDWHPNLDTNCTTLSLIPQGTWYKYL